MAEALFNHLGNGTFRASSAGSKPTGEVHPLAIYTLESHGIPLQGLRSKSWNEFANIPFDIVITVCDSAASEICPVFFGEHQKLHWSTPDPAAAIGTTKEIQTIFNDAFALLRGKIERLINNA
jgi:arsenate reductase